MSAAARRANREQAQDASAAPSRPGGSRRAALTDWRNWRIPIKLAAVVLVPVVFAVGLGIVQIHDEVTKANRYEEISRLATARDKIQPLLTGLQAERTKAAEVLGGAPGSMQEYRGQYEKVTKYAEQAPQVLDNVQEFSPVTSAQFDELRKQLGTLRELRKGVVTRTLSPVDAIQRYNDVIGSLLSLERAVINTIDDSGLYTMINALHELSRAEDEIRMQRALVDAALPRSEFSPALTDALNDARARLDSRVSSFRSVANSEPRQAREVVNSAEMERWTAVEDDLMRAIRVDDVHSSLTLGQWNQLSDQLIQRTSQVRANLSEQFNERAYSLYNDASNRAGTTTVLLFSALVVAAAVMFVIGRHMLGSLGQLRRGALDAANKQLPRAVERIRQGNEAETEVDAVPVDTTEEVGQVARAFDEVNRQALWLASEQANLRRGYSDSFVNVSRRSQSLLERQLRLFEQLEQDEDDPDQLSTLFRLDHLATRMRRNNENLMVLSGSDIARRFTQPVELADVLRAGVSEIEHYPRVVVQSPPAARLVGYAGSDLVRLVAELLDNAANFSSPETSVTVSSRRSEDSSLTIDVLDHGIGMGDEEIVEANERLASFDEDDLSVSRRMGLLVIARLSGRHGITVRLHGGDDVDGIRATVHVPPDLVIPDRSGSAQVPQQSTPTPTGPPQGPPSMPGVSPIEQQLTSDEEVAEQPRRNGADQRSEQPKVNGTSRRQVLEGGLPGFDLREQSAAPARERDTRSTQQPRSPQQDEWTEQIERVRPAEPAPEPDPAPRAEPTPPESTPPEPAPREEQAAPAPELEPEGRVRGLFEPPEGQEYEESEEENSLAADEGNLYFDGFAGTGAPEQRFSDSAPTVVQSIPPGVGTPGPGTEANSADSAPPWFHPAPENARYQSGDVPSDGAEQWQWPSDEDFSEAGTSSGASAAFPAAPGGPQRSEHQQVDGSVGPAPRSEPSGYTSSGLPRRTPRTELDGTAGTSSTGGASGGRSGMSWMEEATLQESEGPSAARGGGQHENERSDFGAPPAGGGRASGLSDTGLPQRRPGKPRQAGDEPSGGPRGAAQQPDGRQHPSPGTTGGETRSESPVNESSPWNFSSDQSQGAAAAASDPKPTDYTSAGLPRRVPKQHLAPGSAAPSSDGGNSGQQNTPAPDETRGRLSSFQQGVRRGRHSAGE
ncbi:sensor histidine kinase [Actinopolyspora saharensis]|uniref:histidine kinase n=1 Tax=Actinopolyspora saharensis TaxID=995062 RepID=A0A1H1GFA1_9ACTN|nr:nitrate- and nitrite sensing domain-containing protein [Actinopolyspora saharensis]SDR11924.1 Signal transduction histidine kinase [Actinopolyspora saharensis]